MRVKPLTDQYELAAALYGTSASALRQRDLSRTNPPQRWLAIRDGQPAGAVTGLLRPDQRMFLGFVCPDPAAYGPLTDASHWGEATFTGETSPANRSIYPRLQYLGAESLGQFFQLVRR